MVVSRAHAGSLFNRVNLIRGQSPEMLNQTAGPGDIDAIDLAIDSQSEMQAKIVLGKVAAASANFVELRQLPRVNREASADSSPITLGALQLKLNPVISISQMIAQES